MAVLASENFEAGTIGQPVQESEVIFSNVDNVGITYVTGLNGTSKACNIAPAGTGACRDTGWSPLGKIVQRFIFKFSSLPTVDVIIAHFCLGNPNSGGLRAANLYLTSAGKLVIRDQFTVVGTSAITLSTGTEYAVEWMFNGNTQQQTLRIFTTVTMSASPAETVGPVSASASGATTIDWIQVGKMTNTTWTGGITIDGYRRANDWIASAAVLTDLYNLEWVGTDGADAVTPTTPSAWTKEGSNTASPKYKAGGPNVDQSYLNYPQQSVGNRNYLTPQLPSGLAIYERFYLMMNQKPELPAEEMCVWSAGTLSGAVLFQLVVVPGVNNNFSLELWADNQWDPFAPDPGEGQTGPEPLGTITDLAVDFFHRVEISVNATTGPAVCVVDAWEGTRRNEPAAPDQSINGSCLGTTLLRCRRYGQMLHSSAAPTDVHRGVAFDGIRVAQNGVAIGPLDDAEQFDPPLNDDWQFYEWDGANLIPLSLAGASLGGATLEEVQFADQQEPPPTGEGLFTNDPGQGKKLYASADSSDSPRYNAIADLYNFEMRTLSAGAGHPASSRCAPGCYRSFYGSNGGINARPSFSAHGASSWDDPRKAAANTAISSWSYDVVNASIAQDIYQIGSHDAWLQNHLAPFIKDVYERYGHLYIFDLANEPDSGNSPSQWTPLYLARIRRAVRYIHFFLKDVCGVPEEAFMVSNATTFSQMTQNHDDAHKIAVNTTDSSWPGARGDAIYYWLADWKGQRTVSGGYWSDAYDPNPVDFIQPGEMDPWNYGRGPVVRMYSTNFYERQYEGGATSTLTQFRNNVPSLAGPQYGRTGNLFKFLKALYGGAAPVLNVSSAGPNGIPVFIGELGLGVWNPLPMNANPAQPGPTADAYCEVFMKDLVEKCNVVAYAKWRYVTFAYNNSGATSDVDSFTHHHKTNGTRGGHLWDPTNSNTKAEAAIFNTSYVADPPPWPNGAKRPPYIQNSGGTKRDRRGITDVTSVT